MEATAPAPSAIVANSFDEKTIPLCEIFGPTIEGEGLTAGRPTYFVRVGGCDYKCEWCDTAEAVVPENVRKLERKTVGEIITQLASWVREHPGPTWLSISGGNPGMYDLKDLVRYWQTSGLHADEFKVKVETQGSRWQPWFQDVNLLTVSPKPPSSGLDQKTSFNNLHTFMHLFNQGAGYRGEERQVILKCIVFDEADYLFARGVHKSYPGIGFYLSTGTAMGGLSGKWVPPPIPGIEREYDHFRTVRDHQDLDWYPSTFVEPQWHQLRRYRWLAERAMNDPAMADAVVGMQQHTLLFGIATKGV